MLISWPDGQNMVTISLKTGDKSRGDCLLG